MVDDDPANLKAMVGHLEQHGFRVTVARDGQEALARTQLVRPDLILMDVLLPGMDGFEICRSLKSNASIRDIPVIFMTVLSDTTDRLAGFAAGGADYVSKPFQIIEVMARVRTHLALYDLRRQLEHQNKELRFARDELEQRVASRTRDLEESRRQVRELSSFQQRMREEEYAHIGRELHDELGSCLTAIKLGVDWIRNESEGEQDMKLAEKAQSMSKLADTAIAAVRRIVSNLRPPMLDDLGLSAAVEWLVEQFRQNTGVDCEFSLEPAMPARHRSAFACAAAAMVESMPR